MSNKMLGQQSKFYEENRIIEAEGHLNRLITRIKAGSAAVSEVGTLLEDLVSTYANSIPVLCSIVAAQFPQDEKLTEAYLHNLIIESYNVRIRLGDKDAEKLLDLFLKRSGRKEDFTTLNNTNPEEA